MTAWQAAKRDVGLPPKCSGCRRYVKPHEPTLGNAHAPMTCPADVALRSYAGHLVIEAALAKTAAQLRAEGRYLAARARGFGNQGGKAS